MPIITAGRTDVEEYFRLSGIREYKKLGHTPLLVLVEAGDTVEVTIVDNAAKLLQYADETKVMGQWRGQWSSDFFQFTVGTNGTTGGTVVLDKWQYRCYACNAAFWR